MLEFDYGSSQDSTLVGKHSDINSTLGNKDKL